MRQANFSYLLSRVELCLIGYLFLEIPFKLFAQQPGNASATESWPHLKVTSCSKMGCRDLKTHLTMDADRRPLVDVNGTSSCLSSNITWNEKICSDPKSCSKNCALGKVNYTESEVISTQGHSVTLKLFNKEKQDGTRFYVMDSKELYKLFQLKNQEVSFEVDVSNAPAGVNAALYFVGMEADGGKSKANQAGAPYGTGFCSSKCPTNLRFVNGKANVLVPTLSNSSTSASHPTAGNVTLAPIPASNATAAKPATSPSANSTSNGAVNASTVAATRPVAPTNSSAAPAPDSKVTAGTGTNHSARGLGDAQNTGTSPSVDSSAHNSGIQNSSTAAAASSNSSKAAVDAPRGSNSTLNSTQSVASNQSNASNSTRKASNITSTPVTNTTKVAPITNFGTMGSCCPEVDVWQANQVSQTFSAHPCISNKPVTCHGMSCKPDALCASSSSCDFSSLRADDRNFYGPSKTVNTMKKFRVITQFITDDGTSSGDLVEIRRLYVQDDKVIENTRILVPRQSYAFNSVTDGFCSNSTAAIQQRNSFKYKGGLEALGKAMENGMVMVLSLSLGDVSDQMLKDPKSSALAPVKNITNSTMSSKNSSDTIISLQKNPRGSTVTFSHIKIGPINTSLKI